MEENCHGLTMYCRQAAIAAYATAVLLLIPATRS